MTNNQLGVTLAELLIALAIGSLIIAGGVMFLRHMVIVADTNKDKSYASLQVQYAGFWINEDVMQAQFIELGEGEYNGFPISLSWEKLDGTGNETITYRMETMDDIDEPEERWRLFRTSSTFGTYLVAEYLDPEGTSCCRMVYERLPDPEAPDYDMLSVWVEVAAQADRSSANSTYEIFPRASLDWGPNTGNCTLLLE
jgi:prepilin-type N-terminal cleavage/methylation domain-containing protein